MKMHDVVSPDHISSRGFSLLEILIAVLIIGMVFTTVLKMHAQTIAMQEAADFYTMAPLLAQTCLSKLQIHPDQRLDTKGDFGEKFPGYTWNLAIHEIDELDILGNTAERLKRVDLMVARHDHYTYQLRTYCLFPP
jgi:general secretion pathway protein I